MPIAPTTGPVTVPKFKRVMTFGFVRKNRDLSEQDVMFKALEENCDERSLAAVDQLGAAGEAVQPIFITIDPERDTVQRLADYAPLFHPRLIALTGTPEEIRQAAAAYRVYYEKAGEGRDYLMNHSGIIYLMDPEGRFVTHFPQGASPDEIAQKIRNQMAETKNQNS